MDEAFNLVKAKAGVHRNTRISPAKCMATMVDKGLLSKLNHFNEVDWQSVGRKRYAEHQLPEDAFHARNVFRINHGSSHCLLSKESNSK